MTRFIRIGALLAASALAAACGTTNGTTSTGTGRGTTGGGTTGGGTTGGSTTGSSTGTAGDAGAYCDGNQYTDATTTNIFLASYPKADEIRVNCDHAFDPFYNNDAGVIQALTGVLDSNIGAKMPPIYAIFPSDCADLGATGDTFLTDGGYTAPAMFTTVAAGVSSASTVSLMLGVVTWTNGPYTSPTLGPKGGTIYIQDPVAPGSTPGAGSGIAIYFPKGSLSQYPTGGLHPGQVITLSNLKWSPYMSKTTSASQKQFEVQANSVVTLLGTTNLPPPVPVSASQIVPSAMPQYLGMRVVQTGGPDTLVMACTTDF